MILCLGNAMTGANMSAIGPGEGRDQEPRRSLEGVHSSFRRGQAS